MNGVYNILYYYYYYCYTPLGVYTRCVQCNVVCAYKATIALLYAIVSVFDSPGTTATTVIIIVVITRDRGDHPSSKNRNHVKRDAGSDRGRRAHAL